MSENFMEHAPNERHEWSIYPYMVNRESCPDPQFTKNNALALGVIAALCSLSPYVLASWDGYSHRCPSVWIGHRCDRWRGHAGVHRDDESGMNRYQWDNR